VVPPGRCFTPESIADMIGFLPSDRAAHVMGQMIKMRKQGWVRLNPMPRFTGPRILAAVSAVVALALFFIGIKHAFIDNRPRDVFFATLYGLLGDKTFYAAGYNESKFRSLSVGMTSSEVEEIMGPPLIKGQWQEPIPGKPITPGEGPLHERWGYSCAAKPIGNYWMREVWFKGGVVYSFERRFYLD
jgi:hypothetical protein